MKKILFSLVMVFVLINVLHSQIHEIQYGDLRYSWSLWRNEEGIEEDNQEVYSFIEDSLSDGKWIAYYDLNKNKFDSLNIAAIAVVKENNIIKVEYWFKNGQCRFFFINDTLTNIEKRQFWYSNGNKLREINTYYDKNDKIEESTEWYINGNLKEQKRHKNDIMEYIKYYNKEGILIDVVQSPR